MYKPYISSYVYENNSLTISLEYTVSNRWHLRPYVHKFLALLSCTVTLALEQEIVSLTRQTSENLPKHVIWAQKQVFK
jgi:hypothetical protein